MTLLRYLALGLACLVAEPAIAQQVAFGGLRQDASLPVEITADALAVDQGDGSAVFSGNVVVAQGEMRLSADRIRVIYAASEAASGQVSTLEASGGVTLVSGAEAAEAAEAVYQVADGIVTMSGEVLLTQGQSALAGERLVIDLASGTGRMEGRVRTIFQPASP